MRPHKHCELIKAWADGLEIECELDSGIWAKSIYPQWNLSMSYRIKPERKRYRVAKFDFGPKVAANEARAIQLEEFPEFMYWLTDWIEYD